MADAPVCYLCGVAMEQPSTNEAMTGRLATHPSNTAVKIYTYTDLYIAVITHITSVGKEIKGTLVLAVIVSFVPLYFFRITKSFLIVWLK